MVLSAIYILMLIAVGALGLKVAIAVAPFIDKFMGCIWKDPTAANHAKVAKRIKELCVDGNTPNETAVLMAAKELNLTEKHINDALGQMTPEVMRALAKGGPLSAFLRATMNLRNKIKGKGRP